MGKLKMIYALRAATPDVPYEPYTLRPNNIARTCSLTPDQLNHQRANRGGLWSPAACGHVAPLMQNPALSWKVHTRVGNLMESPNAIPSLRGLHAATPQPVLGE